MPTTPDTPTSEILIIGAGVLGLCTAVTLSARGHGVRVVDPGGANASSVAAGMIAPALEAVLDGVSPERAALFRDARAAWDGFARAAGVVIRSAPTIWAGGESERLARTLATLGFDDIETRDDRSSLGSDVLVEPGPAMAAMRAALRHPVIAGQVERVQRTGGGWRVVTDAGALDAVILVLATGAAEAIAGLPGPVAALMAQVTPIRGQIGLARGLGVEAVTRAQGVYVAPSGTGAVVGATMEVGRRDLEPDADAGEALKTAAERMLGRTITAPMEWRVGVRGATPDGLPMAGASGEAGLYLALAPRRNGWLLGPLVGQVVADKIGGKTGESGDMDVHAAALDPRRFATR